MKIILEGTSSSGKSSIVKKFPNTYTKVAMDDLEYNREEMFKKLKNKYYKKKEADDIFFDIINKRLSNRVKNKNKFIIDMVNPIGYPTIIKYLPKDTIKILVYTNLNDLVRNIDKRKTYDSRGLFVFNQFTNYYVKSNNKTGIDTVNINDFIKSLKNIKYLFESEKELIKFAKDTFKNLGIKNNKTYYIVSRYKFFNAIINTKDKTPTELKNLIINNENYLLS
jgi:adenylate kinase family enzyme